MLEWLFFSYLYQREHLQQVLMTYALILVFEEARSLLVGVERRVDERGAVPRRLERVERVWLILDEAPLETLLMREYDGTRMLRAAGSPLRLPVRDPERVRRRREFTGRRAEAAAAAFRPDHPDDERGR